jgi:hypothetical protein
MSREAGACARHRPALLDFADRRERGPELEAAFEHLDRCATCRAEVESASLAAVALRRIAADAARAEPSAAAWSRLRDRVEAPRTPLWQVRTTLGAVVVGAALAGALIAPQAIWRPRPPIVNDGPSGPSLYLDQAEQRLQRSRFAAPLAATPEPILAPGELYGAWNGPDGIGIQSTIDIDVVPGDRVR